jgi:4-amino-4-deoxy-L-arabinose transferase-like glycosyltransferase
VTETTESSRPLARPGALAALWATGAALRLAFVWLEPKTGPVADETMWLMALNRIPAAHFSPFANYPIFHPPLYPYFLAGVNALFGGLFAIKIAQALVSSLLIPAVFRIADRTFGSRTAQVAAAIVALYPELVWYSAHLWCETLFLSLFWWAIERVMAADESSSWRIAATGGVLFGLAILTRETLLYLLPFALIWLAWPRGAPRRPLVAALLAGAIAVVAPWTLRNWVQFGAFIPVSTGGGLNLYQGNAEISRGEVYDEYYANEGKVSQYQWARAEGLKAIWRRQPAWLFEKIRDEGPRLFELDSLALIHIRRGAYGVVACRTYRAAAAVVLLPWVLIALGSISALARIRIRRDAALLVVLLSAYLLLHIATHGFSRYRLPVLPVFMILTATWFAGSGREARRVGTSVLLMGLVVALALLWAPSLLDQLGHLGLLAPPEYEGFATVCPS